MTTLRERFMKSPWAIAIFGGALALVLGTLAVNYFKSGSTTATSPPPPTTPGPTTGTGTPSRTPTGSSTTPMWSGPVGITFSGIDFDSNPPGQGSNDINWQRYNYRLQGYGSSIIVSRYPSSGSLPTEAACRSWAQTHNSQILDGVNPGDRLCFITQDGRTVRFIVTDITDSAVEGKATVWNDGNQ